MTEIKSLENELRCNLKGEVRFDDGSRALYATDASNYRQIPIGVVLPRDAEDIAKTFEICRQAGIPILARGAGTSIAGQCCNVAVVMDMSRWMNRVLEINSGEKYARVEPGAVLDSLRAEAAKHGLTFGPDPATHNRCTLGGMIGNNACGVHSVIAGKTVDNLESLEIMTYDGLRMRVGKTSQEELEGIIRSGGRRGEIYAALKVLGNQYADLIRGRYPKIPRRVSGYNLDELLPENGFHVARALVGSEGTCATVLEATVKLIPDFLCRTLVVLGYSDIYSAADDVPRILEYRPMGLEGLDEHFIRNMKKKGMHLPEIAKLPKGGGWLLAEFGGQSHEEAKERAEKVIQEWKNRAGGPQMKLFTDIGEQKSVWAVRESTFGASVFVPGEKDTYSGFEDSSVSPEKLGPYLRDLEKVYRKYGYDSVTYGHFGDGCIHSRISFDFRTDEGIKTYRKFLEDASDLVIQYGGSLSGEHGDGQNWGEFLPKMFGPELVEAFRKFKAIWDPQNKMNPGKIVNPYPVDQDLKLKSYSTIETGSLHFKFPQDQGNFARTTERCIGLGKCLKTDEGTMCPSYMATREEKHSTRGRAHLLHEMMRGEVIREGWKSEAVKESLDLCLSCKACKTECPVNVDMSTYKAEFLSHYYQGKIRPLKDYAFGYLDLWLKAASTFPFFANFFTQTPGISSVIKKMLGIAAPRKIPALASQTFRSWFHQREIKNQEKPHILLWPDTFNNYFYPEVLQDAVHVLENMDFQVLIPQASLCCGRPLYDYGMLDRAESLLQKTMAVLKPHLEEGTPIVGLEPSCVSVFRDELINLYPDSEDAKALKHQTYLFSEFVERYSSRLKINRLNRPALVQMHCHHRSVLGMDDERSVLSRLGLEYQMLDSGCCGMAGAFGFDEGHYPISVKLAERKILPALQAAPANAYVLADGFSCREQIQQLSKKRVYHLAQILERALKS
ncbi:MAG: FAD-binding oxidoreductase [Candidatus Omnitrophica bacterium]|nr:FAD-binding oxidoreductase [Candidatus Omnitrophota bacterium]